jgi:hypothetical protein
MCISNKFAFQKFNFLDGFQDVVTVIYRLLLLVSFLAYSYALKAEAVNPSEISDFLRRRQR